MHVPVQDMQVCCVQQMGTHMLVRAGATYTHRHEDEQDTDAPSLAFFFSTSLPALGAPTQATEIPCCLAHTFRGGTGGLFYFLLGVNHLRIWSANAKPARHRSQGEDQVRPSMARSTHMCSGTPALCGPNVNCLGGEAVAGGPSFCGHWATGTPHQGPPSSAASNLGSLSFTVATGGQLPRPDAQASAGLVVGFQLLQHLQGHSPVSPGPLVGPAPGVSSTGDHAGRE